MSAKSLTVAVPESLFKQIRTRAKQAKRTVEAEVVTLLSEAVSDVDRLPPDIVEVLANVEHLDNAALRDAMTPILTKKQAKRLAALNYKAQEDGLTLKN
jgi:plasmid stability protein